jgi:hypothetical protein
VEPERKEDGRPGRDHRAAEPLGPDADNRERLPVHVQRPADDLRVGTESSAPGVVGEHDLGRRVEALGLAVDEEASGGGCQAQHAEVVRGHLGALRGLRGSVVAQRHVAHAMRGQVENVRSLVAVVEVVGE